MIAFLKMCVCFLILCIRDSSRKWKDKADLLTQLESQVKRMKENFDAKERLLLEERQKATEAQKYDRLMWNQLILSFIQMYYTNTKTKWLSWIAYVKYKNQYLCLAVMFVPSVYSGGLNSGGILSHLDKMEIF